MEAVFVLNCGSSSIKFQVVDPKSEKIHIKGLAENLSTNRARLIFWMRGEKVSKNLEGGDHSVALDAIIALLGDEPLIAIGHRVVHGGEMFSSSIKIDHSVLEKIKACNDLAPLHNPINALGIELMIKRFPDLPQIAVFDTAFHQTLPKRSYLYAIPYEHYEKHQIRRYGFHGTSHRFVTKQAAKEIGKPLEQTSFISAHLGNGCSVCAVKGGKSIDTSMGFTPLEGLVMGERSGDIDPTIVTFLSKKLDISVDAIIKLLNKGSGLLGLSKLSGDMRQLLSEKDNTHAQIAIEVFCYRLAKYVASYIVPLQQVDALIFTGGIGENSEPIRQKVKEYLAPFELRSLVIPTNEELLIAQDAAAILRSHA